MATLVEVPSDERIRIPEKAREWNVGGLNISTRLRNVLQVNGYASLGTLEGVTYAQFHRYRNCGRNTLDELRSFVAALSRDEVGYDAHRIKAAKVMPQEECFVVPAEAHSLAVNELPFSPRIAGVFAKKGISTLVHLHHVRIRDLSVLPGLGRKSLKAIGRLLERVAAGEFQATAAHFEPNQTAEILRQLDRVLSAMPDRNCAILKLWLRGENGRLLHLQEIASRFLLTREAVRQIALKSLERVRKEGGPGLANRLSRMAAYRHDKPLTPEVLREWRGAEYTYANDCDLYVALIAKLCPQMAVRG